MRISHGGAVHTEGPLLLREEDGLELVEVEHAVLLEVVAGNHLLDLGARNFLPQFLEGEVQVLLSDVPAAVRVKLLENGSQSRVAQERLHVDRRRNKLAVVDLAVARVVHLLNQRANLLVAQIHLPFPENLSQLSRQNHTRTVLIDLLESALQLAHLIFARHLHQHVHRSTFQVRNALVRLETIQHIRVQLLLHHSSSLKLLKPRVFQSINATKTFFLLHHE